MDISILDTNYIKVRGKHFSFVVDPTSEKLKSPSTSLPSTTLRAGRAGKTAADAVILLKEDGASNFKNVEGYRIIIRGQGEYEINGAMVSSRETDGGVVYKLIVDNTNIVLGRSSEVTKILDKIESCQILILNADSDINQSIIGPLECSVVVLYGEKRMDAAKNLDKEKISPVQKFSLTKEKLADGMEMEVVILSA